MNGTLIDTTLKVEGFGVTAHVPNNDIAKLMYYLDCVFAVIEYEQDSKFTDYQHYYNLNVNEQNAVCALALLFNPKILIDAKIFIVDPNLVPAGTSNQFYKITDQRVGIHVNEEVMIAGRAIKVLKIMACKQAWLNSYYLGPIERINNRYQAKEKNYYVNNYPNTEYYSNNNNNQRCKKCCTTIFIIFLVLSFLGWINDS